MECVAQAFLFGTARLQPAYGMKTNVFTYAKKDLKAGDVLDGMGGYNTYGFIENLADQQTPGLPVLLNDNLKLKRHVKQDECITLEDVEFDATDPAFKLYFDAIRIGRPIERSARSEKAPFSKSEAGKSAVKETL